MDGVEQLWQFLDLIDHNLFFVGVPRDGLDEPFGLTGVFAQRSRVEKIDPQCVLELRVAPSCLTGAAWPEQKEMSGRRGQEARDEFGFHRKMAYPIPLFDA
jgi:hypothetical protein